MSQTITEKILAKASGKDSVVPGEVVDAKVDTLMMHDVTSGDAIREFRKFGPVKDIIEAGGLTAYNMKRLGLE